MVCSRERREVWGWFKGYLRILEMKKEGSRVEGTDGVGFGTNKVTQPVGGSVDEAVTNPFGRLDAGFNG